MNETGYEQYYEHPTLGKLLLRIHPTMPWRMVAYHKGIEIYETDLILPQKLKEEMELEEELEKEDGESSDSRGTD